MRVMPLEEGASGPHHAGPDMPQDRSGLAAERSGPRPMREGSRQSPKATAQRSLPVPNPLFPEAAFCVQTWLQPSS